MIYYPLIDALRALAVLLILLFHALPQAVPSGFIGVDIFFVISGFLITKIIATESAQENFSYIHFYKRRVLRIFPALLTLLTALLITGWFLLSTAEYYHLATHALSSLGFFQNFNLIKETGYFDLAADSKPLLHLWSLSVEEQFYLIWPFLIAFAFKKSSSSAKLLVQIAISSFFLNFIYAADKNFIFYSPFTRIWELGLGGLVFYIQRDHNPLFERLNSFIKFKKYFPAAIFALLTLFCVFNKRPDLNPLALLALLLLTSLYMIFAVDPQNSDIKPPKILIFIGLISYPLYLWHWSIIVLFKTLITSENTSAYMFLAVLLSFLLSVITYKFIEKPIRAKKNSVMVPALLMCYGFVLAGLSLSIIFYNGFPERYTNAITPSPPAPPKKDICKAYLSKICVPSNKSTPVNENSCRDTFSDGSAFCAASGSPPSVVILGDSHALANYQGLNDFYKKSQKEVALFGHFSFLPFANTMTFFPRPIDVNGPLNYIASSKNIKTVYLSAFWTSYFQEKNENTTHKIKSYIESFDGLKQYNKFLKRDGQGPFASQRQSFKTGLIQTLKLLSTKKVFIILDPPVQSDWNKCTPRPYDHYYYDVSNCSSPAEIFHTDQDEVNSTIKAISKLFSNVTVLDPSLLTCDEKLCYITKDDVFLYDDSHHLRWDGARYLIPQMLKGLEF